MMKLQKMLLILVGLVKLQLSNLLLVFAIIIVVCDIPPINSGVFFILMTNTCKIAPQTLALFAR